MPHKGDDPDYDHWAELDVPARERGWATGSTFALPEATALTSSLRPGAGTVWNTARSSQRSSLAPVRDGPRAGAESICPLHERACFGERLGHGEWVVFWLVVCFGGCHGRV